MIELYNHIRKRAVSLTEEDIRHLIDYSTSLAVMDDEDHMIKRLQYVVGDNI